MFIRIHIIGKYLFLYIEFLRCSSNAQSVSSSVSQGVNYSSAEKSFPIKSHCPALLNNEQNGLLFLPAHPHFLQTSACIYTVESALSPWRDRHLGKPEKGWGGEYLTTTAASHSAGLSKYILIGINYIEAFWILEGKQGVYSTPPCWIRSKPWLMSHKVALVELNTDSYQKIECSALALKFGSSYCMTASSQEGHNSPICYTGRKLV